ncbi:MAG: hypothetical protein H7318_07315 [Oligoflexus sp.]|nr:hypothetical protein [Oligoflexus sp.]
MRTFLKVLSLCAVISGSAYAADNDTAQQEPTQQEPTAKSYVYLKCPSTSLELDAKSLMHDDDGFYSISYEVKLNGEKSLTEACSFVVTDSEGFASNATTYVADVKDGASVTPGEYVGLIPAKTPETSPEQVPSFDIKYEYAGAFAVYFNLEKLEFFVTPLIFIR